MDRRLAVLALLTVAAVGLLVLVLAPASQRELPSLPQGGEHAPAPAAPLDPPLAEDAPEPDVTMQGREPRRARVRYIDVRTFPRGTLVVRPLDGEGEALSRAEVDVGVERVERPWPHGILGIPDPKTGGWTFDLPVGMWRVTATGRHRLDAAAEVRIREGRTETLDMALGRGGAARYVVRFRDGETKHATMALLDASTREPVEAWWQGESPRTLTSPRRGTRVRLPPEGIVYGVPPGRYLVRATSDAELSDEVDVEIRAGETSEVELEVRY